MSTTKITIDWLFDRAMPIPFSGCWVWMGATDAWGYARTNNRVRSGMVHRQTYELTNGPIPKGLVIDHLCRVTACINPAHMEVVTNRENLLRGNGFPATNAQKTYCKHGHSLADAYIRSRRQGGRQCRTCQLIYLRRRSL